MQIIQKNSVETVLRKASKYGEGFIKLSADALKDVNDKGIKMDFVIQRKIS